MIDVLPGSRPLAEFAHRGLPPHRDPAGRLLALAATALLYGALVLLALQGFSWVLPPQEEPRAHDAVVRLLPAAPPPRLAMRDFAVHLIRPHAENAPMPQIVIAPAPSNAPRASLPATTRDTAMAGGTASGKAAGAVSGTGTGGSGRGMAACIDPAYLEQIMRHVGRWYFYPDLARRQGASGVAYVQFVIDKGGHYRQLTLARSSGNAALDAAAMATMRRAAPLPPIPDRFHTDMLDGLMPIVYRMGAPLAAEQLAAPPGGC